MEQMSVLTLSVLEKRRQIPAAMKHAHDLYVGLGIAVKDRDGKRGHDELPNALEFGMVGRPRLSLTREPLQAFQGGLEGIEEARRDLT